MDAESVESRQRSQRCRNVHGGTVKGDFMQPIRWARAFLAVLPIFSMGCVSLSPKLNTLPSVAKNRADVQYQAAQTAEERGQWQKARELYTALHRNTPGNPRYVHRIAHACMQMRDFEAATRHFELARNLDPQNPDLLFDMGMSAYLQKEFSRAESLFAETVRLKRWDCFMGSPITSRAPRFRRPSSAIS